MSNELIKGLFDAIDSSNWDELLKRLHPEIVYERPGYEPLVGIERVLHFYQHERIIQSGKHNLEQIVVDDDHGACWGRFIGVLKSGAPADERFADVYSFQDGKIRERRSYFFRPAV